MRWRRRRRKKKKKNKTTTTRKDTNKKAGVRVNLCQTPVASSIVPKLSIYGCNQSQTRELYLVITFTGSL